MVTVNCDGCGDDYQTTPYERDRTDSNYCSMECYHDTLADKVAVPCVVCGTVLEKCPSDVSDNTFCSQECRSEYQRDQWLGEKNPQYNGGKIEATCDNCGQTYRDYKTNIERAGGAYCSQECVYQSERTDTYRSTIEQARRSGKWKRKRRQIIERDNGRCQECGFDQNLHVHHITPLSEGGEPFDENNLVTLCQSCHLNAYHNNE